MKTFIKGNLKKIICPFLYYTGYFDHRLRKQKEKAIILMYHRIHEKGDGAGVNKGAFERQMEFIKRKMIPIPLTDISAWLSKRKPLPPRAIAITFDDGYEDNFANAYPILRKFDIPATIFLTTGHIETTKVFWWDKVNEIIRKTKKPFIHLKDFQDFIKDGYMHSAESIRLNTMKEKICAMKTVQELFKTFEYNRVNEAVALLQKILDVEEREIECPPMLNWHQIREMSNNGIDFGAHTVTHVNLSGVSSGQAEEEINDSKKIIEENINKPVYGFAYPYGLE
ncbi:MAG: hypothetical protein A2V89_04560, partial [Gammaproteobacteria bacterium RBG_16_37_9]